jgi:hypothetical protein
LADPFVEDPNVLDSTPSVGALRLAQEAGEMACGIVASATWRTTSPWTEASPWSMSRRQRQVAVRATLTDGRQLILRGDP